MSDDSKSIQETWDAFLKAWPIERLRKMTLAEYSTAGSSDTFTSWIESRLDKMGSIWGGSSFKFGIYSRKNKEHKESGSGSAYTDDYAWYPKYGHSPDEVFAKVRSLVVQTAEAASRGDFSAIDSIDLGTAYKWKIAFHYQDSRRPGVIALFKADRLRRWLSGRTNNIPEEMSELYRAVLSLRGNKDLVEFSREIWEATEDPEAVPPPPEPPEPLDEPQPLNLILYGPPGTGKTYVTAEMAVRICDGTVPEERRALMARYRELVNLRRIRFVTFHPSFAYEEFVEGIRPATVDGAVRYDVRSGVFKQTAVKARELYESRGSAPQPVDLQGRKLFKMSLGDSRRGEDSWIFRECIDENYVTVGFAPEVDFSAAETYHAARDKYLASTPGATGTDYAPIAVHYLRTEMRDGESRPI